MKKATPNNTPLKDWPQGWLKLECASLLDKPEYIMMNEQEKRKIGLPATEDEMRTYIVNRRKNDIEQSIY